jgi:hypothetical protein
MVQTVQAPLLVGMVRTLNCALLLENFPLSLSTSVLPVTLPATLNMWSRIRTPLSFCVTVCLF